MDVAIHWQDADSSAAKAVRDIDSNAAIMICGGHAGRAHKNFWKNVRRLKVSQIARWKSTRTLFPMFVTRSTNM